jgi:hypothetical protein
MPGEEQPKRRSLSPTPYDNYRVLVSFTLAKLHENMSWPLRLFPPDISLDATVETTHSYIIFVWPEHKDTDVIQTLRGQVETLKETDSVLWNPWVKFLVLAADSDKRKEMEMYRNSTEYLLL